MQFPRWAPPYLVSQYIQMTQRGHEVSFHKAHETGSADYMFWVLRHYHPAYSVVEKELEGVLYRLLTDPDMEVVWRRLGKRERLPGVEDHAPVIWARIFLAIISYNNVNVDPRTKGQKDKVYAAALRKSRSLLELIQSDLIIGELAHNLVAHDLGVKIGHRREDAGESLSWPGLNCPELLLSNDLRSACDALKGEGSADEKELLVRLSSWLTEAQATSLQDILKRFISRVELEIAKEAEVKSPAKQRHALKILLIKELAECMAHCFGMKLQDNVLTIVKVVLDMKISLTRDGTRDYFRKPEGGEI